jgi:flagellar FliL protein
MANTDTDAEAQEGQAQADAEKKGFVKKLLGNKKLLIIVAAALLLVLGGGGAAFYFFVLSGGEEAAHAEKKSDLPETPPQISYVDMDEMIANIQSSDGNPVYLKLVVSLEVTSPEEKAGIEALKPRIRDQFQAYLRELRPDDLKGSAGVMRIKEELVRRTNAAAAPYKVRDVLLKDMIIQ